MRNNTSLSLVTTYSPKLTNTYQENLPNSMKLTAEQKTILSERIADEFKSWMVEEMEYQIDSMKDNDELDWSYYMSEWDRQEVSQMVEKMVTGVTAG